jgi:hypothetical protein
VREAGLSSLPMLLVPLLAAGAALVRERRTRTAPLVVVVAAASVVAAAVHALVAPEHFAESPLYGWFFVVTAVAGLGYAAWVVLRPSRWLLLSGAAANAAIVGLWLFTRLVAVPLGPGAGETEAFGALDVIASVAELVSLAAASLALIRPSTQHSPAAEPTGGREDVVPAAPALRPA